MKTKLLNLFVLSLVLPLAFVACEKGGLSNVKKEKVNINFKASDGSTRSVGEAQTRGLLFDIVKVTSFKINIGEIEFDFADDDELAVDFNGTFSSRDDIELKGPFNIDLVSKGDMKIQTVISNLKVPVAAYEEIEFEMKKCKDKKSTMFGNSIQIEGEILDTPFIFASDKEFDFEIEFDKPFIPGQNNEITINFYLNKLFTSSISGINFKDAIEFKHDGKIEIFYKEDATNTPGYEFGKKVWGWLNNVINCEVDD